MECAVASTNLSTIIVFFARYRIENEQCMDAMYMYYVKWLPIQWPTYSLTVAKSRGTTMQEHLKRLP